MSCLGAVLLLIYSIVAYAMFVAIDRVFNPKSVAACLVAVLCGLLWPATFIAALLIITMKGQK
jgi:hypothetical protein